MFEQMSKALPDLPSALLEFSNRLNQSKQLIAKQVIQLGHLRISQQVTYFKTGTPSELLFASH